MDKAVLFRHFSDMASEISPIPSYQLYGEKRGFPDVLHIERIVDRAAGLDWKIGPHRHLHLHQIFLLLSGEITLSIDGESQAVMTPALLNIPRGCVHGFRFSAGTEGYVLTLPIEEFSDLFSEDSETAVPASRFFVAVPGKWAETLFMDISQEHGASRPFRKTRLRALATLAMCRAFSAADLAGDQAAPHLGRRDPRLGRFEALIEKHHRQHWTVSDYARELGMSPRHLSRLCTALTGLSALALIEGYRTREACRMLVYTRMSVSSVAFSLGFDDASYFSRSFQRNTGLSPSAYRARFEA
ncbi:helix-turn-helix domain-containing protein [Oryzicola mucosus]|uniref:Helix-turn-helix domain-containing protein n=1 Tax=Oryzicola mucosus TaxID=2767425 RepID=A0A8J6PLP5_9HYPH|nr:helix-turn-helix domain-containing protein [Oryzicola mucosus]MBD0413842.1 helix-turn-helix domain-containing protein [Oryzicola mucosus]